MEEIRVASGATNEATQLKAKLEGAYGKVWTTAEMQQDFEVKGFGMGLCVVTRKSDGKLGSLEFTHLPRFYYNFIEHEK